MGMGTVSAFIFQFPCRFFCKIGQNQVCSGPFDGEQHFHHGLFTVQPPLGCGGFDHGVFTAHIIGGQGEQT